MQHLEHDLAAIGQHGSSLCARGEDHGRLPHPILVFLHAATRNLHLGRAGHDLGHGRVAGGQHHVGQPMVLPVVGPDGPLHRQEARRPVTDGEGASSVGSYVEGPILPGCGVAVGLLAVHGDAHAIHRLAFAIENAPAEHADAYGVERSRIRVSLHRM